MATQFEDDMCIGVVKIDGALRHFYGYDYQFLLDWNKYFGADYLADGKHNRVGAEVVDKDNFEMWAKSLDGELTFEELSSATYADGKPVQLTYFIDFDRQLWIGYQWFQDQSPLETYQPDGWIGLYANVYHFLPERYAAARGMRVEKLSAEQHLMTHILVYREPASYKHIRGYYYVLMDSHTEIGSSNRLRLRITPHDHLPHALSLIRVHDDRREVIYEKQLDLQAYFDAHPHLYIQMDYEYDAERIVRVKFNLHDSRGQDVLHIDTVTHAII